MSSPKRFQFPFFSASSLNQLCQDQWLSDPKTSCNDMTRHDDLEISWDEIRTWIGPLEFRTMSFKWFWTLTSQFQIVRNWYEANSWNLIRYHPSNPAILWPSKRTPRYLGLIWFNPGTPTDASAPPVVVGLSWTSRWSHSSPFRSSGSKKTGSDGSALRYEGHDEHMTYEHMNVNPKIHFKKTATGWSRKEVLDKRTSKAC